MVSIILVLHIMEWYSFMIVKSQGFDSLMVDGSHLPFKDNISHTKYISFLAHSKGMLVEAELGRLSGTEDGLTVEDYEAKLTDVNQVMLHSNLSRNIFPILFIASIITMNITIFRLKSSLMRLT